MIQIPALPFTTGNLGYVIPTLFLYFFSCVMGLTITWGTKQVTIEKPFGKIDVTNIEHLIIVGFY